MSTFKNFEPEDVVSGRIQSVSTGLFSASNPFFNDLTYTSSIQTQTTGSGDFDVKSGLYYYDVYSDDPDSGRETSEYLFSVSYGHIEGAGSSDTDIDDYRIFPTKAVYGQYRNLLLTPQDNKFTFQVDDLTSSPGTTITTVTDSDDIYVINFAAAKYKDKLDPGNFEITLSGSMGSVSFVDDSLSQANQSGSVERSVYNMVVGSVATSNSNAVLNPSDGIGLFYPRLGIVVFNPLKLSQYVGPELNTPGSGLTNFSLQHAVFYDAISKGSNIKARSTEQVPTRQYFVRVKNQEFNYSNNPTFVKSDGVGTILYPQFYNDPKVYITSVGLYDENRELVAIAKLSRPFLKSFDTEALIRIKLDF